MWFFTIARGGNHTNRVTIFYHCMWFMHHKTAVCGVLLDLEIKVKLKRFSLIPETPGSIPGRYTEHFY